MALESLKADKHPDTNLSHRYNEARIYELLFWDTGWYFEEFKALTVSSLLSFYLLIGIKCASSFSHRLFHKVSALQGSLTLVNTSICVAKTSLLSNVVHQFEFIIDHCYKHQC